MDKRINILFFSDLHYSETSMLRNDDYLNSLVDSILMRKGEQEIDILVIAGDICDKGGDRQKYVEVNKVINDLMSRIKIKDVVIVPGNHDISRKILLDKIQKKELEKDNSYSDEDKYIYCREIRGLDISKAIVSSRLISNKYLFLGVNSNVKIGDIGGLGHVDLTKLETELENIRNEYSNYSELFKILIMHHNPIVYSNSLESISENNNITSGAIGNFEKKNWEALKKILNNHKIKMVLTGHVHGSQSNYISDCNVGEEGIYYSSVGSIGINYNDEIVKMLESVKKRKYLAGLAKLLERLKGSDIQLSGTNRHNTYSIIHVTESRLEEQHYKRIVDEGTNQWIPWYSTEKTHLFDSIDQSKSPFICEQDEIQIVPKDDTDSINIEQDLIEIISKEHMYKTGHFHWKNQCAMNWIDTSIFLSNKQYLHRIISYMIRKYHSLFDNAEYLIGLGMKGAIIMTYLRYCYPEKKCSYYPEEENNFNEFEKKVVNSNGKDNIVILTDVIHSGATLRDIIGINQQYITEGSKVKVVSIILTGESREAEVIREQSEKLAIEVEFNALLELPIATCPKSGQSCKVYKEKLDVVYEM